MAAFFSSSYFLHYLFIWAALGLGCCAWISLVAVSRGYSLEPESPALTGRFLTTGPPGKFLTLILKLRKTRLMEVK